MQENIYKNYRGFWSLLAVAFVIFAVLSFVGPVTIMGYELKTSGIWQKISGDDPAKKLEEQTKGASQRIAAEQKKAEAKVIPTDTVPKTILFIGDSMLDGLSPRLAAYAKENGHTLYTVVWYSSTSAAWGNTGKLRDYIARLNPDYIFIALGANELNVKDIISKRDKFVKNMLRDIGSIPYVWIGPPNWKEDTGINDLIAANCGSHHFFLTNGMQFPRMRDGAHPTHEAAIGWMDSVARWMPLHSDHPILMRTPKEKTSRPKRVFVHQPSEIP